MNYVDRRPSAPMTILRAVGTALGVIALVYIGLLLVLASPARSAEYLVIPTSKSVSDREAELKALGTMNARVGCELSGSPVEHGGRPALRFRFPSIDPDSDADFVDCIRRAMPPNYTLEKASWLTSKLHEWSY